MRTTRHSMALLGCLLAFALVPLAHGAEKSAEEFIRPIVSHRQFTALVQPFNLPREQRMILELVFEDYMEVISELYAEADEAADAAGRRLVLDAFSGRRIVDSEVLRQRRKDVLDVYAAFQNSADVHLEILLANVRSILSSDQRPAMDAPERRLRRELYLHPLHVNRHAYEYAGDGVDVIRLVDDAMRTVEELAGLDAERLARVLDAYERNLDSLLEDYGPGVRRVRMNERIARVAGDENAQRQAQEEAIALWRRLYELNLDTVNAIEKIIATELGEDAGQRWTMHFYQEAFAWLFSRTMPDRQYEWIARQSLSDQQRRRIDAAYEEYQQQRWQKSLEAIGLMIDARKDDTIIIYPTMNSSQLHGRTLDTFRRLLRHSGVMAGLDATASAQLESLLSEHQRTALRRAVRPRRGW